MRLAFGHKHAGNILGTKSKVLSVLSPFDIGFVVIDTAKTRKGEFEGHDQSTGVVMVASLCQLFPFIPAAAEDKAIDNGRPSGRWGERWLAALTALQNMS